VPEISMHRASRYSELGNWRLY